MHLSTPDIVIIALYLGGVLSIGYHFAHKNDNPEEFMVAKRSLPGWLLGFSIFATQISNITLISTTGKAFSENWAPLAMKIALPIAIIISCKYFIPFYRKNHSVSAYTHLERRFGPWATIYAVVSYMIVQTFRMSTIMYLISLSLASVLNIDQIGIILATGVVVIIYTYVGGIEAVIWTDFWQGIILVGGVIVSIGYILLNMPEGPSQVMAIACEHSKFSLGSFSFVFSEPGFWVMLFLGLTMYLQDFGVNQTYIQRYISAKSDVEAKRSLWMTLILIVPLMVLVFLLGTCLFSFYTAQPELSAMEGVFEMKVDNIYPHFIATQLPFGIKGLILAAILASAMSSIDSSLNGIATLFFTDIYLRYKNKHPGKEKSMKILHRVSIISGIIAIGVAISMLRIKSIWDVWFTTSTILGGAVFGIFMLGFISKKVNNAAAIVGSILGIFSIIWMTFSCKIDCLPKVLVNPFHDLMTGVIGTLVIIGSGLLYSRFFLKNQNL